MTQCRTSIAFLLPALFLAGCATTAPDNRSLSSVHQPVVSRSTYALDLASDGDGLAPGELARLGGWMDALSLGYGDHIYVDSGTSVGPTTRDEIAQRAAHYGLLLGDTAPVVPGQIGPNAVRVIVTRMIASVPGCPDYSQTDEANFDEHTSSDFGCAFNTNLAAMVARPEDLVRGQPGSGLSDPATAVKAIQTYRNAPATGSQGLKAQSTTSSAGGN